MLRLSTVSITVTLALGCALLACGSSTTEDTFAGSAARVNSAEQDAAADDPGADQDEESTPPPLASAASDASAPAAPRDAGDPCVALRSQVDRLRHEATSCSITSLAPQCNVLVNDVCCKTVVTKDTQSTKNFIQAVTAFKAASCTVDCSKADCSASPTYVCQPMSGSKGTCQQ